MSPWSDESEFGFLDRKLDDSRHRVEYVTPFIRTTPDAKQREVDVARLQGLAFDLALWRAAEIAVRDGFPAFSVTARQFTPVLRTYDDAPTLPRFTLAHPRGGTRVIEPLGLGLRSSWLQGRQTIDMATRREKGADGLDARATIDRLAAQYEGVRMHPVYGHPAHIRPARDDFA